VNAEHRPRVRRRSRSVAVASLALVAVLGASACSSSPSAKRVALETVETLDVPEPVKECMRVKIEEEYTQEQLEDIAQGAASGDQADLESLGVFQADLQRCVVSG
jgi:chorismate mutase